MKTKHFVKSLLLASILPICSFAVANDDDTTPTENQNVHLVNTNEGAVNEETLKVPVTATLSNDVLNVQFTGSVPMATVTVSNAMTGATISQQSMTATVGTVTSVPVAGLSMGTVTVTNQISGQSVSGEFVVADGQK